MENLVGSLIEYTIGEPYLDALAFCVDGSSVDLFYKLWSYEWISRVPSSEVRARLFRSPQEVRTIGDPAAIDDLFVVGFEPVSVAFVICAF